MLTMIKRLFSNVCPECQHPLACESDSLCCTKVCPNGHYKEETYCSLGVSIQYNQMED